MLKEKLRTSWDTGGMPLPEYPRPQLRRDDYTILNGLWDYAITDTFWCRILRRHRHLLSGECLSRRCTCITGACLNVPLCRGAQG